MTGYGNNDILLSYKKNISKKIKQYAVTWMELEGNHDI